MINAKSMSQKALVLKFCDSLIQCIELENKFLQLLLKNICILTLSKLPLSDVLHIISF